MDNGLAEHHSIGMAILGGGDMIHVLLQTGTSLKHVSLDTGDNFGTFQTVATDLGEATSTTQGITVGSASTFGSKLGVPYARKVGIVEDFAVAIADDSSLANPTWSVEQVSSMAPECSTGANLPSSALVSIGGNLAAAWVTPDYPNDKDIYFSTRLAGVWQTPVLVRSCPYSISNFQAALQGSGLVGFLYGYGEDNSGGGVYYYQYQAALLGCRYHGF
jgi:hypothetical protein